MDGSEYSGDHECATPVMDQTELDTASVPVNQRMSDTSPITNVQLESDEIPIAHQPMETNIAPVADDQTESDIEPIAENKIMSDTTPFADMQSESDEISIAEEQMETDIAPIADEQTESDTEPFAENKIMSDTTPVVDMQSESDEISTTEQRMETDIAPATDERTESDKAPIAKKQIMSHSDTTEITDFQSESDEVPSTKQQVEADIAPIADEETEPDKAPIAENQIICDTTKIADLHSESDEIPTAEQQMESDKVPSAEEKLESDTAHIAENQSQSDSTEIAAIQSESEDEQTASDTSPKAETNIMSDTTAKANEQVKSDKVPIRNKQTEPERAQIVDNQVQSDTTSIADKQSESDETIALDQPLESKKETDEQTQSERALIVDNQIQSCAISISDKQSETTVGDQLVESNESITDEKTESDKALTENEQTHSETVPIADNVQYDTTSCADIQSESDKTSVADGKVKCHEESTASEQGESNQAPLVGAMVKSYTVAMADVQMESGIAPISNVPVESNATPIADVPMELDETHVAEEQMESNVTHVAEEQMESNTAHVAGEQMEAHKTLISHEEVESNNACIGEGQKKSDEASIEEKHVESDLVHVAEEQMKLEEACVADEQMESVEIPIASGTVELVEAPIQKKEAGSDKVPTANKQVKSVEIPVAHENMESDKEPLEEEQMDSDKALLEKEEAGSNKVPYTAPITDEHVKSVKASVEEERLESNIVPTADELIKSDKVPITSEQIESDSMSSSCEETTSVPVCSVDRLANTECNAVLTDEQTESDTAYIDPDQSESEAALVIDELEQSDTDPTAGKCSKPDSPVLKKEQIRTSDQQIVKPRNVHPPDSRHNRVNSNEMKQENDVDEKRKGIEEQTLLGDQSGEANMTLVTLGEGNAVLDSTQVDNAGDDSAIEVNEHRSMKQLAASEIVNYGKYEDEHADKSCKEEATNSKIAITKNRHGTVIRMDLKGGTAIIDHIPSFTRPSLQDGKSEGTSSVKYEKSKRPCPEGQSSKSKKRSCNDEKHGKERTSGCVQNNPMKKTEVDSNTCDKVPTSHPNGNSGIIRVQTIPKYIKIVPEQVGLHKGALVHPMTSVQLIPPSTSVYTVPIAAIPPLTSVVASTALTSTVGPYTTGVMNVSAATLRALAQPRSVPVAQMQSIPPVTSISTLPSASTGMLSTSMPYLAVNVTTVTAKGPTQVSSAQVVGPIYGPNPYTYGDVNVPTLTPRGPTQPSSVPVPPISSFLSRTSVKTVPSASTGLMSAPIPKNAVNVTSVTSCGPGQPRSVPVASTGLNSTPKPYTYSHVNVPAVTSAGPTQPTMRFQMAPIIQNQTQPLTNPPHCPGILHLQYNQKQGDQVHVPFFTFLQQCYGNTGGNQCIQQTSAIKPNLPSSILNPQSSVQNAFGQYQQVVNSTISRRTTDDSQPIDTYPHTGSCSVKEKVPESVGNQASSQVGAKNAGAPPVPNAATDSSTTYSSAASSQKNLDNASSRTFEFTSIRIAVPTTMPSWVLVNPSNLTTSTSLINTVATSSHLIHSQSPAEASYAATTQVHKPADAVDSPESSKMLVKVAKVNQAGPKRAHVDEGGGRIKKSRTMSEKELLVERLQKLSAHRLHVILEILQFVTSHRFGSLHNPDVKELTSEELHAFGVLFAAVYGYRIFSEVQIKRYITEVSTLTIHDIAEEEPRRVQEAVDSFGDVGLAKSEKLNRLSQVLFSDYERAFCSATGKPGFAPFCKSRLYVLKHAYLQTLGGSEQTHAIEGERMKHVLDSTANLLRTQMTQEGGYTDSQRVRDWMSKEQARVRTMLSSQQMELSKQRQLAQNAANSRRYMMESQLGCYVMTASEHRMLEDLHDTGHQALTRQERVENLLETILSPHELLLIAKQTEMPQFQQVSVTLAFFRQAFFALCCSKAGILSSSFPKLESAKEWLSCRMLVTDILDRIEEQAATLRCLVLPAEVRVKSLTRRREKDNTEENLETECKMENIKCRSAEERSDGHADMIPNNLGAYVMSKVIAVHLDVVKEIAQRSKKESILQHILSKIITEDGNVPNHPTDTGSVHVDVYLAFLRQCILIVFPKDTHKVQCEIWRRCISYMASILGCSSDVSASSSMLPKVQEKPEEKTVNTITIKEENSEHSAYSFLGKPCSKETLGATVLNADEVSEISHIRDNIRESSDHHAREVAVNELVMCIINQADLSSVPACLALRKVPFNILKLTKLRLSYFYLFPTCTQEAEEQEWAQCWLFLTRSVQSMMRKNRQFCSLLSVPRTLTANPETTKETLESNDDDDDSSEGGMESDSSNSSSSSEEKADVNIPFFIGIGAVNNDCPTSKWRWTKRDTDRLTACSKVGETESGKKVPLNLGIPMPINRIGAHVMTSQEVKWIENMRRTCLTQKLSREQVVKRLVNELYTEDDIIYIHSLRRNKQCAFSPLKMAILRQVYFELYYGYDIDPYRLWSQCWAHLTTAADKIRQKARNTLLGNVVLTDEYKRLKTLQVHKAKLQEEYKKKHMKRKSDSQEQAGQAKARKPKTNGLHDTELNVNITSKHSSIGSSTNSINSSFEAGVPFFVQSGATVPDSVKVLNSVGAYAKEWEKTYKKTYSLITQEGETVELVFGKPVEESKLGAYVMTKEEAQWTQSLKEVCERRRVDKDEVVEFITQNIYTVPEIRCFKIRMGQKKLVFDKIKMAIIRQVYFSVYPANDERADKSWRNFWAYFTKACEELSLKGRSLPLAVSRLGTCKRVKSTEERPLQQTRIEPKILKLQPNQSESSVPEKGAPSKPKVDAHDAHPESQFTLRPNFLRLLQCYSWNPDILVKFLAAKVFTEDELVGCAGNLKLLNANRLKVYETAYCQFYEPGNSAASSCLIKHIHELRQATTSDCCGRLTPRRIREEVEKCAKQCRFSAGAINQSDGQTESSDANTDKLTFSERSKLCRDILGEDIKMFPKYKFERCVHVACKLMEKMFSREELLTGNTAGTRGLCTLDPKRLAVLKCTTFVIAGVATSAQRRTWDQIHHDIDQTLKAKVYQFSAEDRKVEKDLECATVLISSKSRGDSYEHQTETGFQMISCTSLIPSALRRDLLLCAHDHKEVLKRLMNHFMHKGEDWDQFLFRAPSKMKLVRAVYWSICSISIDKLAESWTEALRTIYYLVNSQKLYEHTTSIDELKESAESIETERSSPQMQDETDQSRSKLTGLKSESKQKQQRSTGDVRDTSIRLMKCYKWSKEVVVRLLIQHILTESNIDNLVKTKELHGNERKVIEDAFCRIYGEEEKSQCRNLIDQIIEDLGKEDRSPLCSVWTKKSKRTAVEEAANATLYEKTRSGSQESRDLDCKAFIQEEFPWLPPGEVGKCLFISDHMRKSFFSTEELVFGNCSGTPGWLQLDQKRMDVLKHVIFAVASVPEKKKVKLWQMCRNTMDGKNKKLRKQILDGDEKIEILIQTHPSVLEEQIPDDVLGHVQKNKEDAVSVIRSLVQQLFNPEDLMGDADEMTPSQMKLLQELFFHIHEVLPDEKEEAWMQAMRTINYLNKISGYAFKSGEDGDSSGSSIGDEEEDWTEGMDDYPAGGESSEDDMTTETQSVGPCDEDTTTETQRVVPTPIKEKVHYASVNMKDTSSETKSKSTDQISPARDPAVTSETKSKSTDQIAPAVHPATPNKSEGGVGQCSGTNTTEKKTEKGSDITGESLDWYNLKPVLVQLHKHLKAFKLEEDEIIDELVMHIFGAKVLDGKNAELSLDESIEMLKSAFLLLYNVPECEETSANDLLEERLMHTLMILGQQLTQNMDERLAEDESKSKDLNKPKPYPPMSDQEQKVNKMRSLLMEAFRADERVEMDSGKLKKLKGSKVDAVIDGFQKSFPSQKGLDRKTVMTLVYNLTVELQELVTEKLRYKVDSLTNAYVERAVSSLEEKAKEQATNASSATPLFQAVIKELTFVQRAVGLVPMIRVLLRYLFTPKEIALLQQSDMTQLPPILQVQMDLMQRTYYKVAKTSPDERENAWSCIQWIIAKEINEFKSSDEENSKKKVKSEMFVPVYNRCAVMKCVMGICLSLEEQSQFKEEPHQFENSHPERVKDMRNMYFQIRNIQEPAQDEEWELVCSPRKNYEVAEKLSFQNLNKRQVTESTSLVSNKAASSSSLDDKGDVKPSSDNSDKKKVQKAKSNKEQVQNPKKIPDGKHTEGGKPKQRKQSPITTRSKRKEESHTYLGNKSHKKVKSAHQSSDQMMEPTDLQPTNHKPTATVQHKKTIVVLVDYSICDRVCKIMADEEAKKNENNTATSDSLPNSSLPPTSGSSATSGSPAISGSPTTSGSPPTSSSPAMSSSPAIGGSPETGDAPPTSDSPPTSGSPIISGSPTINGSTATSGAPQTSVLSLTSDSPTSSGSPAASESPATTGSGSSAINGSPATSDSSPNSVFPATRDSSPSSDPPATNDAPSISDSPATSGSPITYSSQIQSGGIDKETKLDSGINNSVNSENSDKLCNSFLEQNPLENEELKKVDGSTSPVRKTQEEFGNEQDHSIENSTAPNLIGPQIQAGTDRDMMSSKDVDQIEVAVSLLKSAVENIPFESHLHNNEADHLNATEHEDSTSKDAVEEKSTGVEEAVMGIKLPPSNNPNESSPENVDNDSRGTEESIDANNLPSIHPMPNEDDILGNEKEADMSSDVDDDMLGGDSEKELQIDDSSETQTASSNGPPISGQSMSDSGNDSCVGDVALSQHQKEIEGSAKSGDEELASNPSAETPSDTSSKTNDPSDGNINKECCDNPTIYNEKVSEDMVNRCGTTDHCKGADIENGNNNIHAQKLIEEETTKAQLNDTYTSEHGEENANGASEFDSLGNKGPDCPPNSNVDILT